MYFSKIMEDQSNCFKHVFLISCRNCLGVGGNYIKILIIIFKLMWLTKLIKYCNTYLSKPLRVLGNLMLIH